MVALNALKQLGTNDLISHNRVLVDWFENAEDLPLDVLVNFYFKWVHSEHHQADLACWASYQCWKRLDLSFLRCLENIFDSADVGPRAQVKDAHLFWVVERLDENFVARGVRRPHDQDRVSNLVGIVVDLGHDRAFILHVAANEAKAVPIAI